MIISDSRFSTKVRKSFLLSALENGYEVGDPNGYKQSVFGPYLYTINSGMRWTPGEETMTKPALFKFDTSSFLQFKAICTVGQICTWR